MPFLEIGLRKDKGEIECCVPEISAIEKQFETINALPQAILKKAFGGEL